MELKKGYKVICITNQLDNFTKGKEYEVIEFRNKYFELIDNFGDNICALINSIGIYFKMEDEKANVGLKKGDELICIVDNLNGFTNGKEYTINYVSVDVIEVIHNCGYVRKIPSMKLLKYFKLKEETKPHSFCETPEEKCTSNYCDENGCMNRKRVLVEPELNVAYKETEGKLFYELDFEFIKQMAERMASNKGKYEPYNWQKLDNIADLKQSLFRHVLEIMNGNYEDDNRTKGHLEAVAINAMFINYQLNRNYVSPSTKINTTDSNGLLPEDNYKKMIEQWKNKSK